MSRSLVLNATYEPLGVVTERRALLLSGILGNLTDRLLHGYVVDFLFFDFGFPPFNPWPAFNVADSCICIAVGCLMLATFFDGSSKSEPIGEPKA
jgi:signal peptidase II